MNEPYSLNSILNAIEDINTKEKNKPNFSKTINTKKITTTISENQDVLPITEKLILEAEVHAEQLKKNKLARIIPTILNEDILVLDNEYDDQDLSIINLEEIKHNIIDDLYSSLSKKVKKNTLKTIFDLHYKINNLEKEIIVLNKNNTNDDFIPDTSENNQNVNEEHLINENYSEENEESSGNFKNDNLSSSVIETLKLQDSLLKNFEKNEEKLRSKIVDLEQDIILLGNKKINIPNKIASIDIEFNQPITKIKSELFFFKENYEKLIIVNDDLKKKLANSQNRIVTFENNIKEIESIFEILRNTLSKNSVIKLNDPLLNIQAKVDQSKKD
jgi:hypothetical protein